VFRQALLGLALLGLALLGLALLQGVLFRHAAPPALQVRKESKYLGMLDNSFLR
jgi:hypothetical protein